MRIILAAPRGFCAGVNMAIESLRRALEQFGAPVYVYHEIVHNRWVVERFRKQGAVFVDELADVPDGAALLFSAHGVSPHIRNEAVRRGLRTIDATCPLVTKVHSEAIRFSREGYVVLLVGHAGHDEVVGTMGEAPDSIVLVQQADDIDQLAFPSSQKLAYLTQTTLSVDDASRIIGRLKERFPHIVGPSRDDICYATQNRQSAVSMLAEEADIVLVVGSRNSSNSQRLAELALSRGIASHLIDGPDDIDLGWFNGRETVVVTAGASAPEDIVERCVGRLQDAFAATVETRCVREEQVSFKLPTPLDADGPSTSEESS
jgi:4-hydroxy-3-methylbut-2-enyl diphosphate reductase